MPGRDAATFPILAGYEIQERLGRGGMGIVYKARQLSLNRIVALKFLSTRGYHWEEERVRFRIEAEAVARLQHPNIVQIHEVGEQDGQPFLVLEYVDGGNLAKRLEQSPLSVTAAARLVATIARGIHVAHEHGIVHRDLKPANVLLTAAGVSKIADFGLAKRLEVADGLTPMSGAVLGTPSYMAPEQASGKSSAAAPAVDIYACGAILYDLITGRPPFKADTPLDTVLQVIGDDPVPPKRLQPKVPRDLETIILKCLEKEPGRRYASALALAEDLERFLEHRPILARPASAWERGWRWARRHPARAAVVLLCCLIVIGTLVSGFWYAEHERQAAEEARKQRDTAEQLRAAAESAEGETRRLLADSYYFTAQLAMRRGDWRTGLAYLDKALAGTPKEAATIRLERVRAWCAIGDVAHAVREIEDLAKDTTLNKRQRGLVLLWHGDIVLSQSNRDAEKAQREFAQALKYDLPKAQAAFARGLLAETSLDAARHLEAAVAEDPYHQRANALLAFLYMSLGRFQDARDRLVLAERLFPDDPTFKFLRACILTVQDRQSEALAVLEEAGPHWSKRDQLRARSWLETLGKVKEAIFTLGQPKASPWETATALTRVLATPGLGKDDKGDNGQTLLLPLPPTVVRSYRRVAVVTPRLMFFKDAAGFKEFADVLRVHPEGSLYLLYAFLRARHGDWLEAEAAFRKAAVTPAVVPIRRFALLWSANAEISLVMHSKGEQSLEFKRRAVQNAREIIKLGEIPPEESEHLSLIALHMQDLELARTIIDVWQRRSPKNMSMLQARAQLELFAGAFGKCLDAAEQMLAQNPKSKMGAYYRDAARHNIRALNQRLPAAKVSKDKKS